MTLTSSFFEKISFLHLGDEGKEEVAQKVIEDIEMSKLYWIELILSCAIATFGLLINSTPVVIGAMLIAPILRPIQAFAFAISTGNKGLYARALFVLVMSMIVTGGVAFLLTYMVPFADVTSEISARISPTILDLLIALASGAVAFLSLGFKKLSESLAGVAMAASLIPPLCVTGIGLNMRLLGVAQGSFLLFLANLVAIIVVGVIVFYAYGFFPTNSDGQKNSMVQIGVILFSIILVAFPLRGSMKDITQDVSTKRTINQTIESFLPRISTSLRVEDMSYTFGDSETDISLSLKVPDSIRVTQAHQQDLTIELSRTLQTTVNLSVELIPVTSVALELVPQEIPINLQLQNAITSFLVENYKDIFLLRLDYSSSTTALVSLSLYNQGDRQKTDEIKQEISLFLNDAFAREFIVLVSLQQTPARESDQEKNIKTSFLTMMPGVVLENFSLLQEEREVLNNFVVPDFGSTGSDKYNTIGATLSYISGAISTAQSIQEKEFFGPEGEYETTMETVLIISIRYASDLSIGENKKKLQQRKEDLEKETGMSVLIQAELSFFSTVML